MLNSLFHKKERTPFTSPWYVSFRYILAAMVLTALILPAANYVATAQQPARPWYEVRSIYTAEYGLQNPRGLVFSPASKAFLVWKDNGNVGGIGMNEVAFDTRSLHLPVEDARNIAFNPKTNSLFLLSQGNTRLEEFSLNARGLPQTVGGPARSHDVRSLNLQSAQGMTFDPATGRLFVLNAQGNQLVVVTPSATSGFRGGSVARYNLSGLGARNFQGIAFNPNNSNLYVLNPANQKLYELTQIGRKVSEYDLSQLQLTSLEAMTFAPSGDQTDDPAELSLFILDSGQQTQSTAGDSLSADGRVVELALESAQALPSGISLLPASLVATVDMSNNAWSPSSPDPSGIDYWPLMDRFVTTDSEVEEMSAYWVGKNVFLSTTAGGLTSTCTTYTSGSPSTVWNNYSTEPTGVAINPATNRIYISDDSGGGKLFEVYRGPDNNYCTSDDVVTRFNIATDLEDVAYGNNTLFIAGGVDAEVWMFNLGPNGVLGGGDDSAITHFDTASLGFDDLEGIGYNPDAGTIFIVSSHGSQAYLGEVNSSGTLLRAYNLSFMGSAANLRSDVTFAPSSQNPAVKNIYIVSRGIDNGTDPRENDGKWWEISIGNSPTATPSRTPTQTNTPDPNASPTFTSTPTNTATSTFTPTATATATNTPAPSTNPLYLSLSGSATVGGVSSADEDILWFDGSTWSLFFDGSDVGLSSTDTFGFSVLDANTLLFTFSGSITLNGIAFTSQDIVRFSATSLGPTTAGTFSMYLDGSDVGLDVNAENLDAVSVLPDDRVLISTTGNPSVPGVSGNDEDVLAFTPTTLGDNTTGTWAMYFDGSDVELASNSSEDVDALDIVAGNIYLSTTGDFSVTSLTGADEDIFMCTPGSIGSVTTCTYSSVLYFDGSTWGLAGNDVDAFHYIAAGSLPTATPTNTLTNTPTATATFTATSTFTPTFTATAGPSPTHTNTATPTNTATNTATPSNTPTPTNTATPTNTPTASNTPSPTPVQSNQPLYLSVGGGGTIANLSAQDVDIVFFDGANWSLFFDASDVGISTSGQDLNDFHIVDSSTVLMTFNAATTLDGIAVDPWDIVQFNATSLGENTAGTFSLYLDGEDVGLDTTTEVIDALSVLPDGRVLISTNGNPVVPALTANDEDILTFTPSTLGTDTSGTWSLYFDGSDVGLNDSGNEDIFGLDVASNGDIYLTALIDFSVSGISGFNEDVFVCTPTSLGDVTACNFWPVLYFDGSGWGMDANAVDGIDIP